MSRSKDSFGTSRDEQRLSLDTIFNLLSASRRRYTLYYLLRHEDPVLLRDVAEQVSEWEQSDSQQPEDSLRTYTALYHSHIPKLAESTVVTYCQNTDLVELTENSSQVRPYLKQTAKVDLEETLDL